MNWHNIHAVSRCNQGRKAKTKNVQMEVHSVVSFSPSMNCAIACFTTSHHFKYLEVYKVGDTPSHTHLILLNVCDPEGFKILGRGRVQQQIHSWFPGDKSPVLTCIIFSANDVT